MQDMMITVQFPQDLVQQTLAAPSFIWKLASDETLRKRRVKATARLALIHAGKSILRLALFVNEMTFAFIEHE